MILETIGFGLATGAIIASVQYLKNRFCYSRSIAYGETTKLPFKTIASIYRVNPERWKYSPVTQNGYSTISGTTKVLLYNANNFKNEIYWPDMTEVYGHQFDINRLRSKIIRVHLSFFDWLKLRYHYLFGCFSTKGTEMILETAQKDIDKLQTDIYKQIETSNKDMINILKKVENERKEIEQI